MAGKIIADTLEHSTAGSVTTDYVVKNVPKSWVNFKSTGTASILDSFNISTLTDHGTGDQTTAFTSNHSDGNYANTTTSMNEDAHGRGAFSLGVRTGGDSVPTSHTSSETRYEFLYGATSTSNGGAQDMPQNHAVTHGDLA